MLGVVLGQPLQGVETSKANGGFVVAELFNGLAIKFSDSSLGGIEGRIVGHSLSVGLSTFSSFGSGLVHALAAVGGDQGDQGTDSGDQREHQLEQV